MKLIRTVTEMNLKIEDQYKVIVKAAEKPTKQTVVLLDQFFTEKATGKWRDHYLARKSRSLKAGCSTPESIVMAARAVLVEIWDSGELIFTEDEDLEEFPELLIN